MGNDLAGISIIGTTPNSGTGGESLLNLMMDNTSSSVIGGITSNVGMGSTAPNAGSLDLLGDLLGDLPMSSSGGSNVQAVPTTNNALLDGLVLNNNGVQSSSIVPNAGGASQQPQNSLDDLLSGPIGGNSNESAMPNSGIPVLGIPLGIPGIPSGIPSSGIPNFVGYDKNDISITFRFDRPTSTGLIVMNLNIVNNSSVTVTDFYLQAAVPKSMNGLEILAASSTNVEANGGAIQQVLKVNNPNKAEMKLMLKVSCKKGGVPVNDQHKVDNFPAELTASH